jgi:hypothetical protein
MSDVLYQKPARYIYQLKIDEAKFEPRLKLFIGEAGALAKTKYNQISYVGGFMGNKYN